MHAGRVEPAEKRLSLSGLALHEVDRGGRRLIVDCLHPQASERSGVFDRLPTNSPPALMHGRVVSLAREALEHASRSILLTERRIPRIVEEFRLFLGVQVIEIAEELVEAVHRREI